MQSGAQIKASNSNPINPVGRFGFALSIVGFCAIALLGPMRFEFVRYMTLSSFIGLIVSLVGLCWIPRKHAVWGVVLGLLGTLFLPVLISGKICLLLSKNCGALNCPAGECGIGNHLTQ